MTHVGAGGDPTGEVTRKEPRIDGIEDATSAQLRSHEGKRGGRMYVCEEVERKREERKH